MRLNLKHAAAAMMLSAVVAAGAKAAAIVNLTLTVNTTNNTWQAFETSSGTTPTSGLAGLQFDVVGSGGVAVTSSLNRLPFGADDEIGATGYSTLRANGAAGLAIRGYQPTTYTVDSTGTAYSIYTGVGLQAETVNVGNSGGSPTNRALTNPVLIASGAFTGTNGSLTISSDPTLTTLLPSPMPAATTIGTPIATFSPDSVVGQSVAVGTPEPTSLALLGLGGLGLLARRRQA